MSFENLKFFKRTENWGDPDRMNPILLKTLDNFRAFVGKPIVITCGTQGVHADESEHYKGNAVDLICPGVKLLDLYLAAERFPFTGIGVYPDWRYKEQTVGGLHVDIREVAHLSFGARWMGYAGSYHALTFENLKKFGVV